jgi:negative regulator of genetic competence, sporulation and motility
MFSQASIDYTERFPEVKEASENAAGEDAKPLHEQKEPSKQDTNAETDFSKTMLQISKSVDYSHFCDVFEKMMCVRNPRKAICMIDGRYSMNENLLKEVHPDDVEDMAVRWFVFFATPSGGGQQTTSEQPSTSQPPPTAA